MTPQTSWALMLLLMGLLVGHGLYWFIGDSAQSHSMPRNVAVLVQIVVAAAIFVYAEYRRRRAVREGK